MWPISWAISSGLNPNLYHSTIRRTVTPVPEIRALPPRTSDVRTINEPISAALTMNTLLANQEYIIEFLLATTHKPMDFPFDVRIFCETGLIHPAPIST